MDFPYGSAGKESACSAGDLGSTPGLGRSPGEGKGYPLQYSGLENSRDCILCILDTVYSPCCCKELDMTERLSLHFTATITSLVPTIRLLPVLGRRSVKVLVIQEREARGQWSPSVYPYRAWAIPIAPTPSLTIPGVSFLFRIPPGNSAWFPIVLILTATI